MPLFLFQSTHPHGVRPKRSTNVLKEFSFNPRTHTGCDHFFDSFLCTISVSIHAPTRGATRETDRYILYRWFQSTHPHGVRLTSSVASSVLSEFQSTHPHGVRLQTNGNVFVTKVFQSTHPHGVRRCMAISHLLLSTWFQSTHPHGVRRSQLCLIRALALIVSIHAPTRGATKYGKGIHQQQNVSIHAPTRGATQRMAKNTALFKVSIHAPTRGATWQRVVSILERVVSIHAPTRGATYNLTL